MDDEKASLNYDCNYNLFLAKRLVTDMKRFRDRQNAVKWLKFLLNSNQSIAEMQLRNDFMYYLVLNLQENILRPPFDNPPPHTGCLKDIAALIPGKAGTADDATDFMEELKEVSEVPIIMSKSLDNGVFLAMQPVPRHGSFCYVTINTKRKS